MWKNKWIWVSRGRKVVGKCTERKMNRPDGLGVCWANLRESFVMAKSYFSSSPVFLTFRDESESGLSVLPSSMRHPELPDWINLFISVLRALFFQH